MLRSVAFEHRIKACIADGGIYDFHAAFKQNMPPFVEPMLDNPSTAGVIDAYVKIRMMYDTLARFIFNDGQWKMGANSPSEFLRMTRQYNLKDCAEQIQCKMLIIDSESDHMASGMSRPLYEALRCPKDYLVFKNYDAAGVHCQFGALMLSNEKILNWLMTEFEMNS